MMKLDNIYIHGRTFFRNSLYLYNTASGIEFNFIGYFVSIKMKTIPIQQNNAWMKVIIDNKYDDAIDIKPNNIESEYIIFNNDDKQIHNIKLLKASEAIESHVVISDITYKGEILNKPLYDKEILVIGDSTVSAYGNLGKATDVKTLYDTDGLQGYAYLTAKYFNASLNSLNGSGWGLCFSPWTTPMRRPLFDIYDKTSPFSDETFDNKKIKPYVIMLSFGTNDSYYFDLGKDDKNKDELINEFKLTYHKMLVKLKNDFSNTPILMVYGLMNEKHNFDIMHDIYLDNKDKFNLYECFILGDSQGVSGHPSKESHKEISQKVIKMIMEIKDGRN